MTLGSPGCTNALCEQPQSCCFPSMSKRHSTLLKAHSNNAADTDTMFSAAEEVCGRAFPQQQLPDGNLGASVRADFIDTDTDVKPVKYK
eukprot:scaffold117425_cov59-Attheya_sp.AAC.1